MERVNRILQSEQYQKYIEKNEEWERDRKFCRHNMGHFLDVARIAMLLNEEEQYGLPKEMIYAAALLHDIGRWKQYEDGTPHEKAGADLAPEILKECGFDEKETDVVVSAVSRHRNAAVKEEKNLNGLLYRADKLSRACFACGAEKDCDWKEDKKNRKLLF